MAILAMLNHGHPARVWSSSILYYVAGRFPEARGRGPGPFVHRHRVEIS